MKLTEPERQLLLQNQGCLKCRQVFVDHKMANCPVGFPDPKKYMTLTQATVDAVRARLNAKRPVTVVQRISPEPAEHETHEHLITAVMGISHNPVAYLPSNQTSVIEDVNDSEDSDVSVHALESAP